MTEQQLSSKLSELLALTGETEVLEFKEAKKNFDFGSLGKYYSALSNEANLNGKECAWLIFGIRNDKTIVGSFYRANERAYLDSLKAELASKTNNRLTFIEIHELFVDNKRVILFQIPAAPQGIPVSFEGHFFGREGESLSPLNIEEIERIRKQVTQKDWSASVCREATFNDLDEYALQIAKSNFKVKNPRLAVEIDSWDELTFLNKAKLAINGKLTNTAILLLGKPESEHFLSPAIAKITWVLKNLNNEEKDYEHFGLPFLTALDKVYARIRNLKYRYIRDVTLFPEEVDRYDPYSIKEALSNCIAHQDYSISGRISVVEVEDDHLIFVNAGDFLPGSVESVLESDEPPTIYRNNFLVQAMVSLNMIDTIGSGIKRMYKSQRDKYFPMPDFDLSNRTVKLSIIGKVINMDYAKLLIRNPKLSLEEIILLDKIQKNNPISDEQANYLKKSKLIEGRKPNYLISESLAIKTKQVGDYLKQRGFDDRFYMKLALEFIQKNLNGSTKNEIRNLLLEKLPDRLEKKQKETKLSTILTRLKKEGKIKNIGSDSNPKWIAL
jgi:ATP-dependent DNA helicase RecG